MIVKEYYTMRKDGVNLYKTYSDKNLMIQKVGTNEIYDIAIDTETAPYTYMETETAVDYGENNERYTDFVSR